MVFCLFFWNIFVARACPHKEGVYGNRATLLHAHGFRSVVKHGATSPVPVKKIFAEREKGIGTCHLALGSF